MVVRRDKYEPLNIETAFTIFCPDRQGRNSQNFFGKNNKQGNNKGKKIKQAFDSHSGLDVHVSHSINGNGIGATARFAGRQSFNELLLLVQSFSSVLMDANATPENDVFFLLGFGETTRYGTQTEPYGGVHRTNIQRALDEYFARRRLRKSLGKNVEHIESPTLRFVTGIVEIDQFLRVLLKTTYKYERHFSTNNNIFVQQHVDLFVKLLTHVHRWLDEAKRKPIYAVKSMYAGKVENDALLSTLINIWAAGYNYVCGVDVDLHIQRASSEETRRFWHAMKYGFNATSDIIRYVRNTGELTISKKRHAWDDVVEVESSAHKHTVSEALITMHAHNEKRIVELKNASIGLGALLLPTLAVVFQVAASLDRVWEEGVFVPCHYVFFIVAVFIHCIAALVSLIVPQLAKPIKWFARKDYRGVVISDKRSFAISNYKEQQLYVIRELQRRAKNNSASDIAPDLHALYRKCGEEFFNDLNNAAEESTRVPYSALENTRASDLLKSAVTLYRLKKYYAKGLFGLYVVMIILYMLTVLSYFIAWI
jgi:hypothetical protein